VFYLCEESKFFLDSRFRSPRWSYGEAGGNDKDKEEIASSLSLLAMAEKEMDCGSSPQ